jgi:hypothetical protein
MIRQARASITALRRQADCFVFFARGIFPLLLP